MARMPYVPGPWGRPEAPALRVAVRPVYGGRPYEGMALLDTGASCCAVPRDVAQGAAWQWCCERLVKTPTGEELVPVYRVQLQTFCHLWRVDAVRSDRPYVIVGRNVLNELRVILDGPALEFRVLG